MTESTKELGQDAIARGARLIFYGLLLGLLLIVLIALGAAWLGVPGTERLAPAAGGEPGKLATAASDFVTTFVDNLITLGALLAQVALFGGLAWLLVRLARWAQTLRGPADRVDVELEDRTASGTTAAASEKLAHEVAGACRRITAVVRSSDLLAIELSALHEYQQTSWLDRIADNVSATAVTVGPLSLSPRQLFGWLSALIRRPARCTFRGWLEAVDGRTRLFVELHEKPASQGVARDKAPRVVRAEASGTTARQRAIDLLVIRTLTAEPRNAPTKNPDSLAAYVDGLNLLYSSTEAEDLRAAMITARRSFEEAVRLDPTNLAARLRLGEVLHDTQLHYRAARHYKFVLDFLAHHRKSEGVDHPELDRRPELQWRCRYQYLSAITQVYDWRAYRRARRMYAGLVATAGKMSREQLLFTAVARTQVTLQRMELLRDRQRKQPPDRQGPTRAEMERERATIVRIEEWFWSRYVLLQRRMPDVARRAHALLQNACGRAFYLTDHWAEAKRYLEWVVTIYRPALDPRPYEYLASTLRKISGQRGDWRHTAKVWLERALEVDPSSSRANYLMARLIVDAPGGDASKADMHFARSQHAASLFWRGRLWVERLDKVVEGLELVRGSIALDNTATERVKWLAEYHAEQHLKAEDIGDVREMLRTMSRLMAGSNPEHKRWVRSTLDRFRKKLKEIATAPAPAAGAPGVTMTHEVDANRLTEDLADEQFTCYVYVGEENDDGWENAKFAHGLVTRLNIYLFKDHAHLGQWVGNKRPKGIAFGWSDDIKQTLNANEAKDVGVVITAIAEAQK